MGSGWDPVTLKARGLSYTAYIKLRPRIRLSLLNVGGRQQKTPAFLPRVVAKLLRSTIQHDRTLGTCCILRAMVSKHITLS